MARRSFHIVPHERGWALKEEGNQDPLGTYDTQKEAIDEGRTKAINDEDEVDLIVHRADGRIRERQTYEAANGNGAPARGGRTEKAKVQPEDLIPVGSRISWAAVLAGVAVALTCYIALNVFGAAIGLSVYHSVTDAALGWGAVLWAAVAWLVSMFLGGFVVSQTTAGETKGEALIYGVVVWGATVLTLALLGSTFSRYGMGELLAHTLNTSTEQTPVVNNDTVALAWLTFVSIILSLLSAMAGAVLGSGPHLVFVERKSEPVAVQKV